MIIIFLYIIAYKNHIQSFNDVDTLAREIDEPGLTQHKIEEMLKQIDGSILTENKYIGHSQYTDFKRAIKGNHKNHTKAHRNAKARADQRDMDETDTKFIAACHFHYEMYQVSVLHIDKQVARYQKFWPKYYIN